VADQNNPLSQKRKTGAEPSLLVWYKSRYPRWGADAMKSKLITVLCIGLIPMLFGIAFPADAAPKQSNGITYNATLLNISVPASANGINDAGQIVGFYANGNQSSFIYDLTQELVTLIRDGTANTYAYGINNAGQVVGWDGPTGNITYGFLYSGGNFTNFSIPSGASQTVALGINSTGQIVGYGEIVNSSGQAANEGFIYNGSTFDVLKVPGATDTAATGINSSGEIVGYWDNGPGTNSKGFIYKNGIYTVINVPGSTATSLKAINDLGQIVGNYLDASNSSHTFIYENGNYEAITVLLGGQVVLGAGTAGGVTGINKAGQIVGQLGTSNCNGCAFVADPVGKPKTH
jgi:probable HAF family extracellular repeat protein